MLCIMKYGLLVQIFVKGHFFLFSSDLVSWTFPFSLHSERQLVDSAVMAKEILASWQRKGTRGSMWKVDFAKAYDSFDWDFQWSSMRQKGFPTEWIIWVRRHIASYSLLALVNRHAGKRGGEGLDTATKEVQTRMPTSTLSFCPSSGWTCRMYISSMLTRHAKGIPNDELSRGHSLVAVCG